VEHRLRNQEQAHDLRDRIVQAGIYRKHAVAIFVAIRVILFVSMLGLGVVAGFFHLMPPAAAITTGALAGLAATLAPTFWLDHVRRTRQNQIRRALPDALDLMGVCLQGGLSLTGSLSRVSQELGTAHPMLALEMAIVEREMQMGLTAGEAMRQFARRFDLEELRSLSSVIGQTEKFGSSVTKALRTYADGLRIKRQQQAEEMAQKAAVKILFPTLLCIFPGIFIVVLGPAAVRIYQMLLAGNLWGQ
jgi:tight adherence protein C